MSPDLRCAPGRAPTPEVGTTRSPWDGAEAHGSGGQGSGHLRFHGLGKWGTRQSLVPQGLPVLSRTAGLGKQKQSYSPEKVPVC